MVSKQVIFKLLERLEESLRRLESKKDVPYEEFEKNWELHGAILHEFQVAIQAIIDIGSHIISELSLRSPNFYGEIAEILSENNIISEEYSKILRKIIAFRNILVHEYVEVDLKEVHKKLKELEDLRRFSNFILEFLKKTQAEI